jgi:hypothetical protein
MNTFPNNIYYETEVKIRNEEVAFFFQLFFFRNFPCVAIVLFLLVTSACKQTVDERNVIRTHEKTLPRPAWISEYPLVFVGGWDDMAIFSHRHGGNPVWDENSYIKRHSEESVKKLKDIGVTMAIIHFYKGFGLEAEKEHMEDAKKYAALCKKYGIKVGVYVGFDVEYETFLLEKPDAKEWFVPDYLGNPVRCPFDPRQTFRQQIYCMHPGYIEYIKRVLRIAIEDFKVDLIHFDNAAYQAGQPAFQHPMAVEDFRTFLKNKYTPEMLKIRFGFSEVKYMEPPKYNQPLSTIDDPLFQEWTDFRCHQLADYYAIMESYIRGLNPEVAIENNPSGITGINNYWTYGVDHPRLLSHTDFFWSEEGNDATYNNEGVIISKIRSYKMASTLSNRVFTYTYGSKLLMAESLTYNRQIGMVGGLLASDELSDDKRSYINFFHKNFDYYHNINNVADVAVLHSYATMAFNNDQPYQSTFLFEQTLIQERIPFDIIFDDNLKDLSKYKVLVLADQECLSDEKLDLIRSFINKGGGLVATEHTSLYTEWRQRKPDFGLNDLFQIPTPSRSNRSPLIDVHVTQRQVGKGRVVYIPAVQPSIPKPPAVAMTSRYWKKPVNWKELTESVQWASGNNLSVSIEAPQGVAMELFQKVDDNALILHLVNFDSGNPSVKNIKVAVQVPGGRRVTQVTVLTPDDRNDDIIQFKESGTQLIFTVPQLSTYNLVVMKLE